MLCEGTLQNLTLSGASSSATKTLSPGGWDYYIVDLNSSNFNFRQAAELPCAAGPAARLRRLRS
jgi:hypothetical protein